MRAVGGFDVMRFQAVPWEQLLAEARELEDAGAGTLWLADHYGWPPRPETQLLEPWTTLAALAASTGLRLGTAVTDVALRHPALLAKQVATVDRISGGRVELAVGAGYWEEELGWLGIPFLTAGGRLARLREGVEIVAALFASERATYEGEHWRVEDAPLVPRPVQDPRPPLLVAANGPKGLRLAAERGDASLTLGESGAGEDESLRALAERNELLDRYCEELGRDPRSLGRAYFVGWASERPFASRGALEDFLGRYRSAGAERLLFSFTAGDADGGRLLTREALDAFAADVLAS